MSKARHQSTERALKRGNSITMPSSSKLTSSGRSLSTTRRTKKYSENLTNPLKR